MKKLPSGFTLSLTVVELLTFSSNRVVISDIHRMFAEWKKCYISTVLLQKNVVIWTT